MNTIKNKEELVRIIKELAKDLDSRAEDIANDYGKRIRSINISTTIDYDCINEWNITKNYPVIVLTDDMIDPIKAPDTISAMAEIVQPIKYNAGEEIRKEITNNLIYNIGIDIGKGLSKQSMYRGGGG